MPSSVATRFSFPKEQRIAKRSDFKRTYDAGRKHFGKHVVLFASGNELGVTRIGITATKKVGKAHDRNRLKRWVREIYRTHRESVGLGKAPLDIVVNLKASANRATFEEFSGDLTRLLRRVAGDSATG